MSGHWFKVVSGACKPKHAPPKSKYIDSLVSSTYQADGSFQDVSQALRLKLRDSNSSVVFKSLLVIHTLIRVGNAEEVMSYWSGTEGRSLGLKDVVSTSDTPQNLCRYANYLLSRFKCYAALKHDPIRTRSEAPASLRHSSRNGANRIRTLTVEKGLLREVATLQKLMDSLVDCKFYLEDTDDDLVMSALRLLVKDLLVLFQAVNEGVINVLEHYFEMSHVDATTALRIYKIFCKQCERVVSYLGVAKKLQNIINVNIPNLRHAPVSLAGSLEEYLNDPNFETNREEYRESKRVADGRPSKDPTPKPKASESAPVPVAASQSTNQPAESQKAFIDFFESIESEQQSMFNPNSHSPSSTYFQQQAQLHPFGQSDTTLSQPSTIFTQPTGMMPPHTSRASMGQALFGTLNGLQPPQFLQSQPTGFSPGGQLPLQPQMTGLVNPFRQSMSNPSGMGSMNNRISSYQTGSNPFSQFSSNPTQSMSNDVETIGNSPWNNQPDRSSGAMSAPPVQATGVNSFGGFPSSLNSSTSPFASHSSTTTPLKAQVTGSRNPFALLSDTSSTPPVPKLPNVGALSMNALAASAFSQSMVEQRLREQAAQLQFQQQQQQQMKTGQTLNKTSESTDSKEKLEAEAEARKKKEFQEFFNKQLSKLEGGGKDLETANRKGIDGLFSNVASEFAVTKPTKETESNLVGGISIQPTGFNPTPSPFTNPQQQFDTSNHLGGEFSSILPQKTGFGGSTIKPFQPSSSFGASLAAQIQQSTPETTAKANPFGNFQQQRGDETPQEASTTNFFNLNPITSSNPTNTTAHQDLMGFSSTHQPNQANSQHLPISNHNHPFISPNPTPSLI